jgi:hypothetical protein
VTWADSVKAVLWIVSIGARHPSRRAGLFHRSMALTATDLVVAVARVWLYRRRCRANRAVRAVLARNSSIPRGGGESARQGDTPSLRVPAFKMNPRPAESSSATCDTVTKISSDSLLL